MMQPEPISTPHWRYCAARNKRVSLFFVLFSGLQALLWWRALNKPLPSGRESIVFYIALITSLVFLAELMVSFKCFRERCAIALAMSTFAIELARRLLPNLVAPFAGIIPAISLLLWMVVLLVSLSLLRSALRTRRPNEAPQ